MDQKLEKHIIFDVRLWVGALVGALVVIVVFAVGGYFFNWTWTGFHGQNLWDWLNLLLLPLALGALPIWFSTNHQWDTRWTLAFVVGALVLAALIVGSYVIPWTWTGFKGETIWDWLNLLLLPIGLAVLPVWFGGTWNIYRTLSILLAVLVLAILLEGTYLLNWAPWTGFKGQKFWDWFSLLIRPVVVTVAAIWFSAHQSQISEAEELKHEQKQRQRVKYERTPQES